jgi:hypothetical protein
MTERMNTHEILVLLMRGGQESGMAASGRIRFPFRRR